MMNLWQQVYCDAYCLGMKPTTQPSLHEWELLGKVKSTVTVHVEEHFNWLGEVPAHTETYQVTPYDDDRSNGKISVVALATCLRLWESYGWAVEMG